MSDYNEAIALLNESLANVEELQEKNVLLALLVPDAKLKTIRGLVKDTIGEVAELLGGLLDAAEEAQRVYEAPKPTRTGKTATRRSTPKAKAAADDEDDAAAPKKAARTRGGARRVTADKGEIVATVEPEVDEDTPLVEAGDIEVVE